MPESRVERSKFPTIDFHTHISGSTKSEKGVELSPDREYYGTPQELLAVMDRKNIRAMVNLTGGYENGLAEAVAKYDHAYPGRFYTFTEPSYSRFKEADYPKLQAQAIERAHRDGARGLKILKTLGLYLRENITSGTLVKIDDARFDPMWDACGQLEHSRGNPYLRSDCVFHAYRSVQRAIRRVEQSSRLVVLWRRFSQQCGVDRRAQPDDRPASQYSIYCAACGQLRGEPAKRLARTWTAFRTCQSTSPRASANLAGSRVTARKFFDKYQDRILFGTDATPHGDDYPQQVFNDQLYEIYYRFLETDDEYFDYAPAKIPPQGRWRIYGIDLPENILRKVYYENAARLLRI